MEIALANRVLFGVSGSPDREKAAQKIGFLGA
jgi:hypothetical protein